MDSKIFYSTRPRTILALVPENPQDSDGDLSEDDDQINYPEYAYLSKFHQKQSIK